MKYIRPQIEVEAMYVKGAEEWVIEWPNGTQTQMNSADFARDFRKMNGQDPMKPRKLREKKQKVNYRSSEEAPDLERGETARRNFAIEAAQEYDHQ